MSSIQNLDRLTRSAISSRTSAFLTVFQQRSGLVHVDHASDMRHVDFQLKRARRHDDVDPRVGGKSLKNVLFVLDVVEIRFTSDGCRQSLTVLDSWAVHDHFLVIQQLSTTCCDHAQQLHLLHRRRRISHAIYPVMNVFPRRGVSNDLNVGRDVSHSSQKSSFFHRRQSRGEQ